jgi:hypothetical protein
MATRKYRKSRKKRRTRRTNRKAGMFVRVGKSVAKHSGDVLKEIVVGEAQNKWKGQDTLIDKYDKLQNMKKPNINIKENAPVNKKYTYNYNRDFEL